MADQTDEPKTLGGKLVKALKNSTGSGKRDLDVEHEGSVARARIHGSGQYGSSVDRLTVVGPKRRMDKETAGREVQRQADAITDNVTYLPERLRQHEIEPGLKKGLLRSRPEEMRDREYNEFEIKGGREVDVARYRYDAAKEKRARVPQAYSHETLERLTDDLAETLAPEED